MTPPNTTPPNAKNICAQSRRAPGAAGRRSALLTVLTGVLTGILASIPAHVPASAHEGDYYPDETIPEKARSIIDDTTNGGSTTLIYVGIGVLVLAGIGLYLVNLARTRRTTTHTTTSEDAGSADTSA